MPRAYGKDTWAEVAVLHALVYGRRRFVVLVQATEKHAQKALRRLQREIETNDLLLADFPEVCYPIRALERITQRAKGQILNGKPTRIEFTADGLVLPTIERSLASGAVVQIHGITAALRGLTHPSPTGEPVRPDLVIVNDAQTRESAKSPTQTADREAIVEDDILLLAGPTVRITVVMLCTVISRGDLSDRFLDADRHPDWRKIRTRMLEAFPDRMDLWDQYAELRKESLRSGDEGRRGNEFYAANRQPMDTGGVVSWPERKKDGEVSGLQSAMNFYIDNPRGFWAEGQNDPQAEALAEGAKQLMATAIAERFSGLDRFTVPRECTRLTAFFDPGLSLIWYLVVAWTNRGGGAVIDYGCFPPQARTFFEARDARPSLADIFPGHTEPQLVYAGLNALVPAVLARAYPREGSAADLRVERALIDCGWQPAPVFQWIRQSDHAATLYPSKGIGRSTTARGVAEWKPRPGERSGWHWRLTVPESGKVRMVQFDPDEWKTRLHGLLTVPLGGPAGLVLFGRSAAAHEMLAAHCAAEYSAPVTIRGATFDKWEQRPDRPDNHLWDCAVGAAVAAGVAGQQWSATADGMPDAPRPRARTLGEMQADARRQAAEDRRRRLDRR
jgi:hypothetical protein